MGSRDVLTLVKGIKSEYLIAAGLIVFAVIMRLVPHPANFAPITAIAIFGAYKLPRRTGLMLPFLAMFVSDLFIGFHNMILWTWGAFVVIALVSRWFVGKGYSADRLIYASLFGSLFFYLVTNFGVWAQDWLYPMTADGLMAAYINGLPFLRNTILGDLFYTGTIFAVYHTLVMSKNSLSLRQAQLQN